MGIQTLRNVYRGINPHLNSELQTSGSEEEGLSLWPTFHNRHIVHIADIISRSLPPHYIALSEQSLQIKAEDIEAELRTRKPEPDVSIYRDRSGTAPTPIATRLAQESSTLLLDDTLDLTEDFLNAVVIRDMRDHKRLGQVVTRIELLSPSNKPGRIGYEIYRKSRNDALFSHVPLIELDYLHESPPTPKKYPVYPHQPGSHSYNIFVSDPRPSIHEGQFVPYGFDVDEVFPIVNIPLAGHESIDFEFGSAYHYTFEIIRWGMWQTLVDYTQLPARFHTYSPADQARIQARMQAIAEAHARGDDLEQT